MSNYEYTIAVTDKASAFISQFTKTLDKVNERFGSARIQGSEAFERITAPLSNLDQISGGLGGKLGKMFEFGPDGEVAARATNVLDQGLGSLKVNIDGAFSKVTNFSNSLLGSVNDNQRLADTLGNVSNAIGTAQSRFTEIGQTVGNLPFAEAVSSVMQGATDAMDGILPDAMMEQWNSITTGLESNVLPMVTSFADTFGFNLDSLSPKIAEISAGFGNFLMENGGMMQTFLGQGQSMIGTLTSVRSTIGNLTGVWNKYKSVLTASNIMAKLNLITMKAQKIATAAFAMVSGKLSIATKVMTVAQRVLNTVLKSNPIIFIIGLLLAGGAALLSFARKSRKVSEETKKMNELQEQTNDILSKGEDLRKRVNNVDNLNSRQKQDLRSDLQNRQKELEDMRAANQTELNSFNIDEKRAQLKNARWGDRSRLRKEIDAYEELKMTDGKVAEQLKKNAEQIKVVDHSVSAVAEGDADPVELEQGSDEIAAGGKKSTNINISLEKMIETLEVHAETLDEGLGEVETKVKEVFLRILNSGNYAAQ